MIKFAALQFGRLSNMAHFYFFKNVKDTIDASPAVVTDALGDLVPKLNTLFAEERALVDWVQKSSLTAKIKAADKVMDTALAALRTGVRSMTPFSVVSLADTATHVYIMLMSYGNVNTKNYEHQGGDVEAILEQISAGGAYYDDVNALKKVSSIVGGLIVDLDNAFKNFRSLIAQRDAMSRHKPKRTFREVRHDMEKVYHEMVDIINANALIGASPEFAVFIDTVNPEIERLNAEFHRVRKDLSVSKHTVIEPVETQPYIEGIPATPVPVVHYREDDKPTVRLSMGKDFVVSYKNNDYVGMAEAIIHGKGDYKGSKSVTFMIAR
jgi:hypothetical protein